MGDAKLQSLGRLWQRGEFSCFSIKQETTVTKVICDFILSLNICTVLSNIQSQS